MSKISHEDLKVINVDAKLREYRIAYEKLDIQSYISSNLKYDFFDWQKKAFENFLAHEAVKEIESPNKPMHLMFNMATGTGKTLLMAACILHYYKKGYRHFIFFVNQNNIVDKTENNFVNSTHNKYLFKDKIVIEDQTILIKKVDNFSNNPLDIEIKFTSIQKLYNDIHKERENQTTLADLHCKDIVMLADEAHHLNTETKAKKGENLELDLDADLTEKSSAKEIEKKGWEHAVIELVLNKNRQEKNNKNILLEFTATIPENQEIAKKYEDKIIAKFGLKEFLQAGYTKEINLISSTLDKKERVLQALLFQWYRHKIALKHNIANFKPVILFRSKTIDDSKKDYEEFLNWVDNISNNDFDFLKNISNKITQSKSLYEQGKSRTESLLDFIAQENINFGEIANWIKQSYQEKNTIITNSKDKSAKGKKGGEKTTSEQDKLINNLEDKSNNIRAIFTVDRLTEGWDVLNLFDIVRLYSGQNAGGSTNKTPESTTKEKQLIGRGVRYFPFNFNDKIKNKRKFDDDLKHELRVLEELYYYTYDEESKYISHLKEELKKDGYLKDDRTIRTFDLKPEFKESEFYKKFKIWKNKRIPNPDRIKSTLKDLKEDPDFNFEYKVKSFELREESKIFEEQSNLNKSFDQTQKTIYIHFKNIEKHIFRKAVNIKAKQEGSLFRFENLREDLQIESIDDLQKDGFLGDFRIKIITSINDFEKIPSQEKLNLTLKFLEYFMASFKVDITPEIGSEKFYPFSFAETFSEAKPKSIDPKNEDQSIAKDNKWYVLDGFAGTSEEKELVEFIKDSIGNLEKKYKQIYLLKNEEIYKIFDFKKGRGFQPDFLLFLAGKDDFYYKIFIEPKGNWTKDKNNCFSDSKEAWKEEFLLEISNKYGNKNFLEAENKKYRLIGLPFYNQENKSDFEEEFLKNIM